MITLVNKVCETCEFRNLKSSSPECSSCMAEEFIGPSNWRPNTESKIQGLFDDLDGLIKALESNTEPCTDHTDPNSISDCWNSVSDYLRGIKDEVAKLKEKANSIIKAFTLAGRFLADNMECPASTAEANFIECNGELDECGSMELCECWKKFFIEKAQKEAVCRVCGCTWNNACEGGCSWVEPDLCSKCSSALLNT